MNDGDKYVVFKREDWQTYLGSLRSVWQGSLPGSLESVVLRPTDIFGAPALYGYAHLVQTFLEVERLTGGSLSDDQYRSLEKLADYFVETAKDWQRRGGQRLPD